MTKDRLPDTPDTPDSPATVTDMAHKLREANFLISLTAIADRNSLDFDTAFQEIAQAIADFSESPSCCEIRVDNREYLSRPFVRQGIEICETISATSNPIGHIKVYLSIGDDTATRSLLRKTAVKLGSLAGCRQLFEGLKMQTSIVDSLHESVIYRDMNGYIRSWNKGAERLFGFTQDEAIGRHISLVYPKGEYEILENRGFEKLFSEGYFGTDVLLMKKDGSTFHAHLSLTLVEDAEGNFKGMIGLGMDIDKRKRAEISLHDEKVELISNIDGLLNRLDELQQRNVGLREALADAGVEKMQIKAEINRTMADRLLPIIKRIREDSPDMPVNQLAEMENEIILMAESDQELQTLYSGLTSREIEISTLIREGRSTREIADTLFISPETVQKHRRNIRKKLGITGKTVNLPMFLKTHRSGPRGIAP